MLTERQNPLFQAEHEPTADLTKFATPAVHRRPLATHKRDLRDVRRAKTAAEAIGPLDREVEIYGFTKGQFSIVDIINHVLDQIGPARLDISTWTAANSDITTVLEMVAAGRITQARWLVDLTFNRRSPELARGLPDVDEPEFQSAIRKLPARPRSRPLCVPPSDLRRNLEPSIAGDPRHGLSLRHPKALRPRSLRPSSRRPSIHGSR